MIEKVERGKTYLAKDGRKGVFIASHPHDGALLIFNEKDREDDDIMIFYALERSDLVREVTTHQ